MTHGKSGLSAAIIPMIVTLTVGTSLKANETAGGERGIEGEGQETRRGGERGKEGEREQKKGGKRYCKVVWREHGEGRSVCV